MTVEELRKEAKALGYRLVKIEPYIKLEKCPFCGKKPTYWSRSMDKDGRGMRSYVKYSCPDTRGQLYTDWFLTEKAAKLAWNELCKKEGGNNGK